MSRRSVVACTVQGFPTNLSNCSATSCVSSRRSVSGSTRANVPASSPSIARISVITVWANWALPAPTRATFTLRFLSAFTTRRDISTYLLAPVHQLAATHISPPGSPRPGRWQAVKPQNRAESFAAVPQTPILKPVYEHGCDPRPPKQNHPRAVYVPDDPLLP